MTYTQAREEAAEKHKFNSGDIFALGFDEGFAYAVQLARKSKLIGVIRIERSKPHEISGDVAVFPRKTF